MSDQDYMRGEFERVEDWKARTAELELAADRARRIRALAAERLASYDRWERTPEVAAAVLEDSAHVIDALDALPVPGKAER